MLLIGTVLPVAGTNLEKTPSSISDLIIYIKSSDGMFEPDGRLGCSGYVWNEGEDNITFNVSFSVISYSFKLEYLGESSIYKIEKTLQPGTGTSFHIIPEYYGEILTWVKATLEINNGEETVSEIGISIGKWILFFYFLT